MKILTILALSGLGGGLGAMCRVGSGLIISRLLLANFAYTTLFVNILGSFLIGIFMAMKMGEGARIFLIAGFCGGFTTFSSFSYESLLFLQNGEMFKFILNLGLNFIICLLFCYIGLLLFRG
ncbi:MAG: CrcB family protein [Campylobacter sp.]|nr:CrcB family protein [Campylobacter sp.]